MSVDSINQFNWKNKRRNRGEAFDLLRGTMPGEILKHPPPPCSFNIVFLQHFEQGARNRVILLSIRIKRFQETQTPPA